MKATIAETIQSERSHLPRFARVRACLGFVSVGVYSLVLTCLLAGCQTAAVKKSAWRETLREELPLLGHRNWIVVADSAYPAQTSPGIFTVYTGSSQVAVVEAVVKALASTKHVQPIIYVDAELAHVPESLAPGVEKYRAELKAALSDREPVTIPHEQLIAKLDEAGKTFRVLILKTDLTIPYTSVFFQLDCGYWGPNQERQLRKIMGQ